MTEKPVRRARGGRRIARRVVPFHPNPRPSAGPRGPRHLGEARLLRDPGRPSRRRRGAAQESAYRKLAMENHPGPQPGRPGRRGALQGGLRGLRGALGRREASRLRPLRPRGRRARALGASAASRTSATSGTSPTCSTISSGTSSAAPRAGVVAPGGDSAAPTSATTSRSSSADVLDGIEPSIQIPKMRPCGTCDGSGARPGTSARDLRALRRAPAGGAPAGLLPDSAGAPGRVEGMQSIRVKMPGRDRRRHAPAPVRRGRGRDRGRSSRRTSSW